MIGIFLGEQNSGKTLAMTYYAYYYYKLGYKIFSNYNLKFPHQKISKQLIIDYLQSKKQLNKSVFLIDEIYLFLDSRSFGQKSNKLITYFLLQTSKRDVILLGTAQYFNTVEKRFRENCGLRVFCSRVKMENEMIEDIQTSQRFLEDPKTLFIRLTCIIRKNVMGLADGIKIKTKFLRAQPVFKLYDTRELLDITED